MKETLLFTFSKDAAARPQDRKVLVDYTEDVLGMWLYYPFAAMTQSDLDRVIDTLPVQKDNLRFPLSNIWGRMLPFNPDQNDMHITCILEQYILHHLPAGQGDCTAPEQREHSLHAWVAAAAAPCI